MITNQKPSLFEEIKKTDEYGNEYWSARVVEAAILQNHGYMGLCVNVKRFRKSD